MLDRESAVAILNQYCNGVIKSGGHANQAIPLEGEHCDACVMELHNLVRVKCLGEARGWADNNDECRVLGNALRTLNDSYWESDQIRTQYLFEIGLYEDKDCAPGWENAYAEHTIRQILPIALRAIGLNSEADRCEKEGTAAAADAAASASVARYVACAADVARAAHYAAHYAARYAARYAADAASASAARYASASAARYAADAADAAASARAADAAGYSIIKLSASILLKCVKGELRCQ